MFPYNPHHRKFRFIHIWLLFFILYSLSIKLLNNFSFRSPLNPFCPSERNLRELRICVVFSENCASSGWCLDELWEILECKKHIENIVDPIFYNVERSDVRHQRGSFADNFASYEQISDLKIEGQKKFKDGDLHYLKLQIYQRILYKLMLTGTIIMTHDSST